MEVWSITLLMIWLPRAWPLMSMADLEVFMGEESGGVVCIIKDGTKDDNTLAICERFAICKHLVTSVLPTGKLFLQDILNAIF